MTKKLIYDGKYGVSTSANFSRIRTKLKLHTIIWNRQFTFNSKLWNSCRESNLNEKALIEWTKLNGWSNKVVHKVKIDHSCLTSWSDLIDSYNTFDVKLHFLWINDHLTSDNILMTSMWMSSMVKIIFWPFITVSVFRLIMLNPRDLHFLSGQNVYLYRYRFFEFSRLYGFNRPLRH